MRQYAKKMILICNLNIDVYVDIELRNRIKNAADNTPKVSLADAISQVRKRQIVLNKDLALHQII